MDRKKMQDRAHRYDIRMARRQKRFEQGISRKRLEFAQKLALFIVVFSMSIVFLTNLSNFVLLWNGRTPMTDETIATISTFGGITATAGAVVYSSLTCLRDLSLNRHALTITDNGKKYIGGDYNAEKETEQP